MNCHDVHYITRVYNLKHQLEKQFTFNSNTLHQQNIDLFTNKLILLSFCTFAKLKKSSQLKQKITVIDNCYR